MSEFFTDNMDIKPKIRAGIQFTISESTSNPVVKVEKSADAWEDEGKASLEADTLRLQPLIGTVTSYDGAGGYINQTTYFSRYTLSEGNASGLIFRLTRWHFVSCVINLYYSLDEC